MKILSISGHNLANIVEPFSIKLDRPPFTSSGIFAITGCTGSGKSTLLDALCLALYDRIPRLERKYINRKNNCSKNKNTQQLITTNTLYDVRNILRNGTASGFAEVVFSGIDNKKYIARWEVKKAHDNINGRLQKQTISLLCIDSNQKFHGNKTTLLKIIRNKIGLNFEQFKRSVLLAQGECAALLKASPYERAELLEQMTGTEIFSQLSIMAHKKEKSIGHRIEQLNQQLSDYYKIPDTQLVSLKSALSRHSYEANIQQKNLNKIEKSLDWQQKKYTFEKQLAIIQTEKNKIKQALNEVTSKKILQDHALAHKIAHEFNLYEKLNNKFKNSKQASKEILSQLSSLHEQIDINNHHKKIHHIKNHLQNKLNIKNDVSMKVESAKEFEIKIDTIKKILSDCTEKIQAKKTSLNKIALEKQDIKQNITLAGTALEENLLWIEKNEYIVPIAENFSLIKSQLERQSSINKKITISKKSIHKIKEQVMLTEKIIDDLSHKINKNSQDKTILTKKINNINIELDEISRQHPNTQVKSFKLKVKKLDDYIKKINELSLLQEHIKQNDTKLSKIKENILNIENKLSSIEKNDSKLSQQLIKETPIKEYQLPEMLVQQLRKQLEKNTPCCICGSTTHPWNKKEGSSNEKITTTAKIKHIDAISQLELMKNEFQKIESDQSNKKNDYETLYDSFTQLHKQIFQHEYISMSYQLVESCFDEMNYKINFFQELSQRLQTLHQELIEAQKEISEISEQCLSLQQEKEHTLKELAYHSQKLGIEQHQQSHFKTELAAIILSLNKHLIYMPDWTEKALKNTEDLVKLYAQIKDDYKHHHALKNQQLLSKATLTEKQKSTIKAEEQLSNELYLLKSEEKKLKENLNTYYQNHSALLNGVSSKEFESQLSKKINNLQEKLLDLHKKIDRNKHGLSSLQCQYEIHTKYIKENSVILLPIKNKIYKLLNQKKWSISYLKKLLEICPEWAKKQESEINQLEAKYENYSESINTLTKQLQNHLTKSDIYLISCNYEDVASRHTALKELHKNIAKIKYKIEQHYQLKEQADQTKKQVKHLQRKHIIWLKIKHAIGSHDGSRFRLFVQNKTLDLLINYANKHLEILASRYTLSREEGRTPSLYLTDKINNNALRSAYFLSGGESFLISLALALGLASLSVNKTRIESLFIDEGFGTLDHHSLNTARSFLDKLQAQGKQIGIISHINHLIKNIHTKILLQPSQKQGYGFKVNLPPA